MRSRSGLLVSSLLLFSPALLAQGKPPVQGALSADPRVAAAQEYIGRALILRGFPAGNDLRYDATGRPSAPGKITDWTLAGMDLQQIVQHGPAELELDGIRVGTVWNRDGHVFDRKPLRDQHLRVLLDEPVDAAGVRRALDTIFSTGIDSTMQRSMPPAWLHYFLPAAPWAPDALDGATIVRPGPQTPGLVLPAPRKQFQADYTETARATRTQGSVELRLVVDAGGVPRRVSIVTPLGMGLDAEAVRSVERWQFTAGQAAGAPAAMEVRINQQFVLAPGR